MLVVLDPYSALNCNTKDSILLVKHDVNVVILYFDYAKHTEYILSLIMIAKLCNIEKEVET